MPAAISWRAAALDARESILLRGAAEFGSAVALQTDDRLVEAVAHLADNPQLGRHGRIAGTRELVAPRTPFLVIYRYEAEPAPGGVEVVEVVHHAQRWPAVITVAGYETT